jgi:hypothetical protein
VSFTYSVDLDEDLSRVRFLVGDTNSASVKFQDEELTYLLDTLGNVNDAAAAAIDGLIAKYADRVDKTVGPLSISYSQAVKNLQTLRSTIAAGGSLSSSPIPFAMARATPLFSMRRPGEDAAERIGGA